MAKDLKKYTPQIKVFHIFLIFCLLSPIFLLNSKNISNLRGEKRLNSPCNRKLDETENESKTTHVCDYISDNLKEYYETGDKTILGIDDDDLKIEQGEHIQALINVIKIHFSKKEKEKTRRLFGEQILGEKLDEETMSNLIVYGKHIIPLAIFLFIALLSLPGWLCCICCFCCCKCCCCCCCKKPSCKVPSFIFSYICYGIVALVSFYGLTKSDSIFVGVADTECSILKLVDEVLVGETNTNPPYWAGIEGITDVLNKLSSKVDAMKANTVSTLQTQEDASNGKKSDFEQALNDGSRGINDNYKITGNQYQLDIAKDFGKFTKGTASTPNSAEPENSISDLWYKEYSSTITEADNYFTATKNSFNTIFTGTTVTDSLTNSKKSMKEIEESFDDIKVKVAGNIIKHGDDIDKNGKLIFKILYSVLIFMDAGVAAFMLLLCFCSGDICSCCSCARCFCKFFIHILWNIMAFFMVALFMFGSIFALSGKIGNDMTSVVSYLVSKENLGQNSETILLGDVKKYLNKCFNSDGEILSELGFNMGSMNSFDILKNSELQLEDLEKDIKDKQHKFVYNEYNSQFEKRVNYKSNLLSLKSIVDGLTPSEYKFVDLLKDVNDESVAQTKNEKWDISSDSTDICVPDGTTITEMKIYHPSSCYPTDKLWVRNTLATQTTMLNEIKNALSYANNVANSNGIKKILNDLSSKYDIFLGKEKETIQKYIKTIQEITGIVHQYSGKEEKMFSFINCKFLKTNVQILLVNLKNVFGNDIYMNGIYLLLAACSLAVAIMLTILLVYIINQSTDENKNKNKKIPTTDGEVPEVPVYSEGRKLQYPEK